MFVADTNWKRWWIVTVCAVLGGIGGRVVGCQVPPKKGEVVAMGIGVFSAGLAGYILTSNMDESLYGIGQLQFAPRRYR
jgi:hypothetical protein